MYKRLLFASITYGPSDPQAIRSQRVAIMTAARHGIEWVGDASPDRMKFDVARNAVARIACDSDADAVFWCDSDIILPPTAVLQLARHDNDFVTGVYFQREPPHYPLIATFDEDKQTFNWLIRWPDTDCLAAVDGCGFGCVLTSTRLLRMFDGNWFTYRKFSEDFDFCLKARDFGHPPHVDTSVLCGHLPEPAPVTFDTYKSVHPEYFGVKEE